MPREKLGSVWIDTATVIVGDPCQLLPDNRGGRGGRAGRDNQTNYTYAGYMVQAIEQGPKHEPDVRVIHGQRFETPQRQEPAQVVRLPSGGDSSAAIAVRTCEGCDGWAAVYLERDRQGRPRRLIVDLVTKVKVKP